MPEGPRTATPHQDRSRLDEAERLPARKAWLPLGFVVLSLLALLLVPSVVERRIDALREEIWEAADPARDLTTELRVVLVREGAALRGLRLTGDEHFREELREARTEERRILERLRPFARQLGPGVEEHLAELRSRHAIWRTSPEGPLEDALAGEELVRRSGPAEAQFAQVRDAAARLDAAIDRAAAERREKIQAIERLGAVVMVGLALLALLSALLVGWLTRRLQRRAQEEVELRDTALALTGAVEVEEVLRRIAESAVLRSAGDSSYVERIDPERHEVEVVAVAGEQAPPVGTKVKYPGSLTERVLRTGEPEIVADVTEEDRPIARVLAQSCRHCTALVTPLISGDDALGALVILRGPGRTFRPHELLQPRILGVLAALALRRAILFDEVVRRRRAAEESEARFRAIFEEAGTGVALVDMEGRLVASNPALQEMFGYTEEELRARHFAEITHPEDVGADQALYEELVAGERERYHIEKRYLRGNGEIVWGRLTVSLVRGDGAPRYAVGLVEDITERRRAEQEREQLLERERQARGEAERRAREEEALREAAAAVSAAFTTDEVIRRIAESATVATNADGAFVERIDLQKGEVETVAVAGKEAPPLRARIPYPGSLVEAVVMRKQPELIARLGAMKRPVPDHLKGVCRDCSAAVVPLIDAGEPIGALTLLRTPEKRSFRPDEVERAYTFGDLAALSFRKIHLLEESERRREELQRVTESRARLMRGFSHDVKNPLGAASGYLELLEEGIMDGLSEKQKGAVHRARRSISGALDLIEDLLELARAEAGQIAIERVPTDAREATREIAEEYRAQAEAEGLTLDVELPEEFPVVESDPSRIRQILSNLLSNALKYTPEGGHIRVQVAEREGALAPGPGRWIAVDVRDTGPGIATEKQELLFQEFTRLDPGAERGAGVGLAISRKIAHALGGEITVESEVGKGSTFTLWLPLAPAASEAEPQTA